MTPTNTKGRRVSPSREDYLKTLWHIGEKSTSSASATSELAEALQVSPPAVSRMMKQMERQGLVTHVPYYGASLTARGHEIALGIVRRHRLLETFLVITLGYALDEVHDEAERLEHHISDEFTARLDALLGYPRRCPHGSPIPPDEKNRVRQIVSEKG